LFKGQSGKCQFGIEEADVERCVVDDEFRAVDEFQQRGRDLGEPRLVLQAIQRQAVHRCRAFVDLAFGIEVTVEGAFGDLAPVQLDGRDFDDAMPLPGIETRGFRVQYDLPHACSLTVSMPLLAS
jgi:hypothetical protein